MKDHSDIPMYFKKSFDFEDVRFIFLSFTVSPHANGIEVELEKAFNRCDEEIGLDYIVRQTIFIPAYSYRQKIYDIVCRVFKGELPATGFVRQPLLNGEAIGVELWIVIPEKGKDSDHIKRETENLTIVDTGGLKWAFLCGIEPANRNEPISQQVATCLEEADVLLRTYGFGLSQVIRTWFYTGEILEPEGRSIRYDEMNRIRNIFYQGIWANEEYYPASTGIGIDGDGFVLDAIALKSNIRQPNIIIRIDNPLQTRPYNYNINKAPDEKPTFCRGVVVSCDKFYIIFISGTASIRGSDVVFKGDIIKQTKTTIENIASLIDKNNLKERYGLQRGASLKDIQQIRVYLKGEKYGNMVKHICEQSFPRVPQLYCIADICRPSLLVEIEAIAVVSKREKG